LDELLFHGLGHILSVNTINTPILLASIPSPLPAPRMRLEPRDGLVFIIKR
jgi:hypothetical protein